MIRLKIVLTFFFVSLCINSSIVKCDQNTLTYLSSFTLGRQNDLNRTFGLIQKEITIPNLNYTPRIGKEYIISNITLAFFVINSKQKAEYTSEDHLRIHGAVLKLSYNFTWEKRQLGSSVHGTAEGVVLSDPLDFTKVIQIKNDQPDEELGEYKNVTFTNDFPVSKVTPYTQNDSETLFIMMNKALSHQSGKDAISQSINQHFATELNNSIQEDSSELSVPKNITYSYFDYRGEFKVEYSNPTLFIETGQNGAILMNSQVIVDDPNFQCGPPIRRNPEDKTIFGGNQQILSNSLLKSTVKYILSKGFFNVKLNQDNWESRAFQFCVGDIYQIIPSLKNQSATDSLSGECKATNDETFNFSVKSQSQYLLTLNFSCVLNLSTTPIIKFTMMTEQVINVTVGTKSLNFIIHSVSGKPSFQEIPGYKIQNPLFANFLISETLRVAVGSPTFGTGYKTNSRQLPSLRIRPEYILLYDGSAQSYTLD